MSFHENNAVSVITLPSTRTQLWMKTYIPCSGRWRSAHTVHGYETSWDWRKVKGQSWLVVSALDSVMEGAAWAANDTHPYGALHTASRAPARKTWRA